MPVRTGDDRTPAQKGHDEQLRRQDEETRQANRGRRESLDEARLAEKKIGIERAKLELEARLPALRRYAEAGMGPGQVVAALR
jgi:hypothetical protein